MTDKIKGKTIDEINQMIAEAEMEARAKQEEYFAEQWGLLQEEIAEQEQIRQYEDQQFGRLVMEDEHFNKGWIN